MSVGGVSCHNRFHFLRKEKRPLKQLSSTPVQQAERHIRPASRRNGTEEENQGPQKKKKPIPDSESNRHSAQMRIQQSRAPAHRGGSTDPGLAIDSLGRKRKLRSRDKTDTKKRVCDTAGEPSSADPLAGWPGLCIRSGRGKERPQQRGSRAPLPSCRLSVPEGAEVLHSGSERPNHIPTRDTFNSAVQRDPPTQTHSSA